MSCDISNALEYFPGDNQPIEVTLRNDDKSRIADIQTTTDDIVFQAKDDNDTVVIDLRQSASKIALSTKTDSTGATVDIATISPATGDTDIAVGTYDIFMMLDLNTPERIFHVNMTKDGQELTKLIIKEGGVTV